MPRRRLPLSPLLLSLLLPACMPQTPLSPEGDDLTPAARLGSPLRPQASETPDRLRPPSCTQPDGCPVNVPVTKPVVYRFWGSSANSVWAVGKAGLTMHWNGVSWRRFGNAATGDLWAVWGSAANDIWAVGDNATILHWDGSAWSKTTGLSTTAGFNDVWGTSASDAWTVGDSGAIWRWDGSKWAQLVIPFVNGFMAVYGATTNDVWVGGEAGLLLHWDGTKMNEVPTGSFDSIWRIRGSSISNVYLTTEPSGGVSPLQRWDGSRWSAVVPAGSATVLGPELWVIDNTRAWSATTFGFLSPNPRGESYYWNGMAWTSKSPPLLGVVTAIWATATEGWISSASGNLARYNGTSWVKTW